MGRLERRTSKEGALEVIPEGIPGSGSCGGIGRTQRKPWTSRTWGGGVAPGGGGGHPGEGHEVGPAASEDVCF